jgi:hypothetical protein
MHDEEVLIAVAGMLGVFGLPVIWIIAHYGYLACKHWQATRLVRDMVGRGYTAQEIIQICQVLGHRKVTLLPAAMDVPPAKPIRQPAYAP